MLLTIQWSAGRPRPAIADLDERDAVAPSCMAPENGGTELIVFSEPLRRIQQYRDRPFVNQFHLHRFLKPSRFAAQAGGADFLDKIFVEFARLLGRSGCIERWTLAAPRVSVESELRDHQQRAGNLRDG